MIKQEGDFNEAKKLYILFMHNNFYFNNGNTNNKLYH